MTEPITQGAIAGASGYSVGQVIALRTESMFLGSSPEAFILGLVGAFAVCAWLDDFNNPRKTYAGIFLAMLIAGIGSPAVATVISAHFDYLKQEQLLYILPLLIGVFVPILGPTLIRWAKRKWGTKND